MIRAMTGRSVLVVLACLGFARIGAAMPDEGRDRFASGALVKPAKSEPDLTLQKLPSRAATKTIAILLISGEEVGFGVSEIYANARRVIEANTALNVAPLDVISLDERAQVIRGCAGKASCFAERVRSTA